MSNRASVGAVVRSLVAATFMTSAACGTHDAPRNDSTAALAPAPAESAKSSSPMTPVRGSVAAVSDTSITVTTATGAQTIHIVAPLHVYTRTPSDLAHVTPNAFVGITSVAQPDGSQRATEIHVFPEELRGTGEGSRMMEQTAGSAGRSTMTNGSVSPSRMTNGSVAGSRMTNGTVGTTKGATTYTVTYQGGTQTIEIPAGVTVTTIALTQTRLVPGANVVVLTKSGPDGRPSASAVILSAPIGTK